MHIEQLIKQNSLASEAPFKVDVCLITPEMATNLLSLNTKNRDVRISNKKLIISELKSNRWQPNGATIVIGADGVIKDGQHRLLACEETKIPIISAIAYGVRDDSWKTIDVHAKRVATDHFKMNGVKNAHKKSQVASAILAYEKKKDPYLKLINGTFGNAIPTAMAYERYIQEKEKFDEITNLSVRVYTNQKLGYIFTVKQIALVLYFGKGDAEAANGLIDSINGKNGDTYLSMAYKKGILYKTKNISFSTKDKVALFVRGWNEMLLGNKQYKALVVPKAVQDIMQWEDRLKFE